MDKVDDHVCRSSPIAIVEVSPPPKQNDSRIDGPGRGRKNRKSSIIYVSGTLSGGRARAILVSSGLLNSLLRNTERERVRESRVERGIYFISGQCPWEQSGRINQDNTTMAPCNARSVRIKRRGFGKSISRRWGFHEDELKFNKTYAADFR